MSDGSRSEGAEEEKIGAVGRREREKRGRRWKDDLVGEMERGMAVLESEGLFADDI